MIRPAHPQDTLAKLQQRMQELQREMQRLDSRLDHLEALSRRHLLSRSRAKDRRLFAPVPL